MGVSSSVIKTGTASTKDVVDSLLDTSTGRSRRSKTGALKSILSEEEETLHELIKYRSPEMLEGVLEGVKRRLHEEGGPEYCKVSGTTGRPPL